MAAITVHLDIVSPEAKIYSGLVEMVSVTGAMGELGILPGHTQLLSSIKPGQVNVTKQGGEKVIYYISGGFLEVQPDCITILADTVVRADNLDEVAAEEAKARAEKLLAEKKSELDYAATLRELAQAAAQIRTIKELRKNGKLSTAK
ncbi:MAG: F0F1 ATP synthase subunit epsilon [Gammaproteobacteria bacterium]|nr:F0F1 ATP synthase subunit epsilon [Gammaproteobacteria bacterium]